MSLRLLTGCVRVVCSAPEVVLQQLVRPGGTGSSHQPHCGLMKKHLQEKTHTHQSCSDCLSSSIYRCLSESCRSRKTLILHNISPHKLPGIYKRIFHSTMSEYSSVSGLTTEPHKMMQLMWILKSSTSRNITNDHQPL